MNFTGQSKRSRPINLGGRNANSASKDSILKRAQQDRERRQKQRKEEQAAIFIQSHYRRRIDVIDSRLALENEWNQKYIGMDDITSSTWQDAFHNKSLSPESRTMSTEELTRFILQFNFFFPHSNSPSHVKEAQTAVVLETIKSNINQIKSGEIDKALVSCLTKALSSVFQDDKISTQKQHNREPIPLDTTIFSILELLQEFSATRLLPTCSKYIQSITQIDNFNISKEEFYSRYPQANGICKTLLNLISHQLENKNSYTDFFSEFLATPGLHIIFEKSQLQRYFAQVFKSLKESNDESEKNNLSKVSQVPVSSHPFGGSSFGGSAINTNPFGGSGFGSATTPSPFTPSQFGAFGSSFDLQKTEPEIQKTTLGIIDELASISQFRCVWRFVNYIYFFAPLLPSVDSSTKYLFYQVLGEVFEKIHISIDPLNKKLAKRVKKLDLRKATGEVPEISIDRLCNNKLVIQECDYVVNRDFFSNMTTTLLESQPEKNDVTSISLFSSIVTSLMFTYPSKQQFIILYVTLSPLLVIRRLWDNFTLSSLYQTDFHSITSADQLRVQVEKNLKPVKLLVLFLEVYSYWLIVANDDEFYGSQSTQGLPKGDVENLARFLRDLSYILIWNSDWIRNDSLLSKTFNGNVNMSSVNDSPEAAILKLNHLRPSQSTLGKSCVMVMRQIYLRDSRRKFLNDDFWLMTGHKNAQEFVVDAVKAEVEFQAAQTRKEEEESEEENSDSDSDFEGNSGGFGYDGTRKNASLASRAPCLELLRQAPFMIPFNTRLRIFEEFVWHLQEKDAQSMAFNPFGPVGRVNATIRRENMIEDAFNGFDNLGSDFRKPISVRFVGEFGLEAGIGPGVTKEFLTVITKDIFIPSPNDEFDARTKAGLFVSNQDQLLYPNPILGLPGKVSSLSREERNEANMYMMFCGKILGKCIYENILVDVNFAPFFLQKWQQAGVGYRSSFDDLYSLDPELYGNLIKLYNYPGDVENDLMLDFTITQKTGHGSQTTVDLRPNGSKIPVTNANRLEYIHAVANFKLNSVLHTQTSLFLKGLSMIVPIRWLSMFNAREMQMLISGKPAAIDIDDLQRNSMLSIYDENEPIIQDFWQVLREMKEEDKQKFIKFVTSVSKAPLLGFGSLNPKFAIRFAGDDVQRLPTSSTCVNLLKLPRYDSKEQLRTKLLEAIRADVGFELS